MNLKYQKKTIWADLRNMNLLLFLTAKEMDKRHKKGNICFYIGICFLFLVKDVNAQDTIVTKDSRCIYAKIIRVSDSEVEYKNSNNPDGPTFVLSTKKIASVAYANGEVQVFNKREAKNMKHISFNNGLRLGIEFGSGYPNVNNLNVGSYRNRVNGKLTDFYKFFDTSYHSPVFDIRATFSYIFTPCFSMGFGAGYGYSKGYQLYKWTDITSITSPEGGLACSYLDSNYLLFFARANYMCCLKDFTPFFSLDMGFTTQSLIIEYNYGNNYISTGLNYFISPALGIAWRIATNSYLEAKVGYQYSPKKSIELEEGDMVHEMDLSRFCFTLGFTQTFRLGKKET